VVQSIRPRSKGNGAHGSSMALLSGGHARAGHDSAVKASAKLLHMTANMMQALGEKETVRVTEPSKL
jgi:hypothetical protein